MRLKGPEPLKIFHPEPCERLFNPSSRADRVFVWNYLAETSVVSAVLCLSAELRIGLVDPPTGSSFREETPTRNRTMDARRRPRPRRSKSVKIFLGFASIGSSRDLSFREFSLYFATLVADPATARTMLAGISSASVAIRSLSRALALVS